MSALAMVPLRAKAPWRVLDGFGRSLRVAGRYAAPRSVEELAQLLAQAKAEGLTVAFRGAGRSYGDAALNARGLVIDATALSRILHWDPGTGIIEAEAGLTIEGLWRNTIADGYWPAVVPGTMHPTLGGCVAMNIHGKNNYCAGPFGEHVLEFDLLTTEGTTLRCSPTENAEVFYAAIGGLGLLGATTRVKLRLKHVESGHLRVESLTGRDLNEMFDLFEARLSTHDYLVGWIDCFARRGRLGRGVVHAARHLKAGEDPDGKMSLQVQRQGLPTRIAGIPKSKLWRLLRLAMNDPGVRVINALKYYGSLPAHGTSFLQSHVAFAFLLDYVPNWRLAYGPAGFIQYQVFVPHKTARDCLRDVLLQCQDSGLPAYLGVLKRHRPDAFLLSHALDGWSLALDFRVTERGRARLWEMTRRLTERVLAAGGKFYFAKDAVLAPADVERAYGRERLDAFLSLKNKLDPSHMLATDLWRRTMAPRSV